jgi:uncharacterized repeat protein (TIGR01451 family)
VFALVLVPFWTGASRIVHAQSGKPAPSKIASIVQDRITKIQTARSSGTGLSVGAARQMSTPAMAVSDDGQLDVEFHSASAVGAFEEQALIGFGATILGSTAGVQWPAGTPAPPNLGIITVRMPAGNIASAAALDWVVAVTPAERQAPDVGQFLSEGVALHKTAAANSLGITGAGVSVGVVSDGVSNIAASQALGDLPMSVNVLDSGSGDEGTAMLEIIHDLAPDAALLFHGTGGGVASHIMALMNLATAGANVIAEDIPFDSEPAFQKGAAATAGENLVLSGVSMHSSAGNLGATHSARVAAVGTGGGPDGNAGPFSGCPFNPLNTVAIAPSNDTTFDVSVGAGGTLSAVLQWSEPRAIFPTPGRGGFTDLDLFVMDAAGTTCLTTSTGTQANGVGDTIEQVSWTNGGSSAVTVKLVVNVTGTSSAVTAPQLDLRWRGANAIDTATRAGSLNPDSNYTFGATSAAAADASTSTDPTTISIEGFSAGGPVQLVSTTICPNGGTGPCTGVAGGAGQTATAPTWTAADGVSVSGAGGFGSGNCPAISQGDCRFFGTSAAVPHAAAVAALVRQALGSPDPFQITAAMVATAKDRGAPGIDNVWGAGVLNALAAAGEEADLSLVKDCQPNGVVDAGQTAVCTITVQNDGPSLARNLQLTDSHSGTGTFTIAGVTPSQGSCTVSANVVTCALGDLAAAAPGVSGRATVIVNLSATQQANISDVASVVSDTPDPDLDNNQATDSISFRSVADVRVSKTDSPDPVIAGQTLTYTLTVANDGPSPAANVIADDFLPAGVTIVSVIATGGASCIAGVPGDSSRPTECTFGTLAASTSRTMTVVVTVGAGVTGTITNDASVRSDQVDPNGANNVATAITTVSGSADLVIQKSGTPSPVLAGKLLTYQLKVFNNGPSSAAGVVVEDLLPRQVTFVKATIANGAGTCVPVDVSSTPPTTKVTCQLGQMAPNVASPVFIFIDTTVKSDTPDGTGLLNTATIASSTTDPVPANNTASAIVPVINRADLAILTTSDADVYKPSSTIAYTITVADNGPSDALNVVVTDNLPDIKQAIYVFDTASCAVNGSVLTCNLGTIAAGTTRSLNVYVTVKGSKGQVTDTASVTSSTFDPVGANNSSTRIVLIGK